MHTISRSFWLLFCTITLGLFAESQKQETIPIDQLPIALPLDELESIQYETFKELIDAQHENKKGYIIGVITEKDSTGAPHYHIYDLRSINEWVFGVGKLIGTKKIHTLTPETNKSFDTIEYYALEPKSEKFVLVGDLNDITSNKKNTNIKKLIAKWYTKEDPTSHGELDLIIKNNSAHPIIVLIPSKKALSAPIADFIVEPTQKYFTDVDKSAIAPIAYIGELKTSLQKNIARKISKIPFERLRRRLQQFGIPFAKKIDLKMAESTQEIVIQ